MMTNATLEPKAVGSGQAKNQTVADFIDRHGTPFRLGDERWVFPDGALLIVEADGEVTFVDSPSADDVAAEINGLSARRSAEIDRDSSKSRMDTHTARANRPGRTNMRNRRCSNSTPPNSPADTASRSLHVLTKILDGFRLVRAPRLTCARRQR